MHRVDCGQSVLGKEGAPGRLQTKQFNAEGCTGTLRANSVRMEGAPGTLRAISPKMEGALPLAILWIHSLLLRGAPGTHVMVSPYLAPVQGHLEQHLPHLPAVAAATRVRGWVGR